MTAFKKKMTAFKKKMTAFKKNAVIFQTQCPGVGKPNWCRRIIHPKQLPVNSLINRCIKCRYFWQNPRELLPFMTICTFSTNFRLHFSRARSMKSSNVCFLFCLGLHLVFIRLRPTGFLEHYTFCQYLFYIHIIQILSVPHFLPKQIL